MKKSILDMTPFIPSDEALGKSSLPDKALELNKQSAKLTGQLSSLSLETLEQYMRVINSYYSNLIEGNATLRARFVQLNAAIIVEILLNVIFKKSLWVICWYSSGCVMKPLI